MQLTTTDTGPVGQSIPKLDRPTLVTGKPAYTADWTPEGLLHLKVLRSPHPHARIRSIHTEKARAMSGVLAVFTHKDVPRIPYSTAGHGDSPPDTIDHYLLDNKYELRTGSVDVGTGSDTTLRQIAAHVLGAEVVDIELQAGDTLRTPYDSGAYASATTFISGEAVNKAAQKLRSRLAQFAAKILHEEPEDVIIKG